MSKITPEQLARLAKLLDMSLKDLTTRLGSSDKTFVYLRRQVAMEPATEIQKMKIPGIGLLSETRRSYPQGSLMAHIVGFTNIEDRGIEGVELEFNKQLSGQPGLRKVLRDRLGRDRIERHALSGRIDPVTLVPILEGHGLLGL